MQNAIIVLSSELTRQTAGTPRLNRFISTMVSANHKIILIDTSKFFFVKKISFLNKEAYFTHINEISSKSIYYKNGSKSGKFTNFMRKIKHFFFLESFTPAILYAIIIITKYKKNKIFASSPGIINLLIASLVKFFDKDRYIWLDLRDEWAQHKHIYFHKWLRKKLEKFMLNKANIITTVSEGIKRNFEKEYKLKSIEVIYNFDASYKEKSIQIENNNNFFNFAYFGSMPDGYYNEKLFLEYIQLIADSIVKNKKIIFNFIGFNGKLKELLLNSKYKKNIQFFNAVSHTESLQMMKSMDILIFFAYDSPNNGGIVSTKLLEYINSSSKILPFSIKKNSDIDIIMKACCNKSLYLNSKKDLLNLIANKHYLENLPSKTCNTCFIDMENKQMKIIKRFLSA